MDCDARGVCRADVRRCVAIATGPTLQIAGTRSNGRVYGCSQSISTSKDRHLCTVQNKSGLFKRLGPVATGQVGEAVLHLTRLQEMEPRQGTSTVFRADC
jgi:hypothetical protein